MLECIECPYYDYGLSGQYCDKVGGKTLLYGYCTYVYEKNATHKNNSKQKRRNKRERDQKHRNHLKFLAENITGYVSPVIYTNEIWIKGQGYVEAHKPYYKRYYRGSNSNYHKKMSNKKIRRYKGELPKNGNLSHRLYDFWWELY